MIFLFIFLSKCQYEIQKKYNAIWLKIFYHNSTSQIFFQNKTEALNCNLFHKYSILNEINNKFLINGKYEFLLEYPELIGYNRWFQTQNPLYQNDNNRIGYSSINLSWTGKYWEGLGLSNNEGTFLDGSNYLNYWWYSIGSINSDGGLNKFPGPAISNTIGYYVSYVYLWIRIDGTQFQIYSNFYQFNFKFFLNLIIFLFL